MTGAGRYAPSPSGDLHVGNLRTALLAWMCARSTGRSFWMRVEDLDRVRPGSEQRQLADLAAVGVEWDEPLVRQSGRRDRYAAAVAELRARDLTYECYCTRREIQQAGSAPHGIDGGYPGTCRDLTETERVARRGERPAAVRLRAQVREYRVHDALHGAYAGAVDDLVLVRNDGLPAYNLAVVVDDGAQGVDQVVRGDDLLGSAPRQAYLGSLLGLPAPEYVHVPLALNDDGRRLAKRDGAVTLADLASAGLGTADVVVMIADSLGMLGRTAEDLLEGFDLGAVPREPWVVRPPRVP